MRHPTKKQMQRVIDRLKTILPMAKKSSQLDMNETKVEMHDHRCGTFHCVGGWYAVACKNRPAIKEEIERKSCGFSDGAHLMAEDLGLSSKWSLEEWADQNPKIWGNKHGGEMFVEEAAFGHARTMRGVVRHLERVRDRLPK